MFDDWFDPIEAGVRDRVREFIQAMVEGELDAALMRPMRRALGPAAFRERPAVATVAHDRCSASWVRPSSD